MRKQISRKRLPLHPSSFPISYYAFLTNALLFWLLCCSLYRSESLRTTRGQNGYFCSASYLLAGKDSASIPALDQCTCTANCRKNFSKIWRHIWNFSRHFTSFIHLFHVCSRNSYRCYVEPKMGHTVLDKTREENLSRDWYSWVSGVQVYITAVDSSCLKWSDSVCVCFFTDAFCSYTVFLCFIWFFTKVNYFPKHQLEQR